MSNAACRFLLICLLAATSVKGQETSASNVTDAQADGFFAQGDGFFFDNSSLPGWFNEDSRFFEILRAGHSTLEVPFSLEEAIDLSTAIVRGYFVEVLPGREFTYRRRPTLGIETVILKVATTSVLKGDYQQYFYVEYAGGAASIDDLNEDLYSRELLLLLRPAVTWYPPEDTDIATSREAQIELSDNQSIYNITLESTLFTMSSGNLTSPIDVSMEFISLYTDVESLDDLAFRINEILASQN